MVARLAAIDPWPHAAGLRRCVATGSGCRCDQSIVGKLFSIRGSGCFVATGETCAVGSLEREHGSALGLIERHARSGANAAAVAGTLMHPMGATEMAHGSAWTTGGFGRKHVDRSDVSVS